MKFKVLTEENFILFAMKHYDNPSCEDADEFYSDLNRIKYIKRLIRKYLLNHLIIFFNVFGIQSAKRMIFFRFEEEYHSILKTFLVYLNYIKDNETIDSIELVRIPINTTVANVLREIK